MKLILKREVTTSYMPTGRTRFDDDDDDCLLYNHQ